MESVSFHLCFGQLNPRKKAFKNLESLTREDQQASTPKRYQVIYILCGGVLIIPVSGEINPRIKPFKTLENYFSGQKIRQTLFQAFISTGARREGQHATKISGELYCIQYYVERELINPCVSAA